MSEIYLKCQYSDDDEMIVSIGDFVCFEIVTDGKAVSVCLDDKQAYTLIKYLHSYRYERLD
jgi:hypothetical protein